MDSIWTWALAAVALIAAAVSYRVPRAWLWIACMAVSFLVTTTFLDYAARPDLHPFLTFACDALICITVFQHYREDWELGVFLAFLCSTFASLLRMGGFIPEAWVYASLLEICNAGALLWIAGTGLIDMIGRNENSPFYPVRARLHSPRHSV